MGLELIGQKRTFANILRSDGTIRVQSTQDNPEAIRRDYETPDGTKGTKYELVYNRLSGRITNIEIQDGKFGEQLMITINDGEDFVLTSNVEQNFATDIMRKLPNVDLQKEVTFAPYSFEDDKKKRRKGVTIYQGNKKLQDFFFDKKKGKELYGIPTVTKEEAKTYTSKKWKKHFEAISDFLVGYTNEKVIASAIFGKEVDVVAEEDNIDVPFK